MNTTAESPTESGEIDVHVTFAAAKGPYNNKYAPNATAATVLQDALNAFKIQTDGTTRYFFILDGTEVNLTVTIGALAGHSHSIKLSLRTETISGSH
jgi:hypothetical protein